MNRMTSTNTTRPKLLVHEKRGFRLGLAVIVVFGCSVIAIFYKYTRQGSQRPLQFSNYPAITVTNHLYGAKGVIRRRISIGDGIWGRMSLESDEYPSGMVSNVYDFPSGSRTVQVLELPGSDRGFGSPEYEAAAKQEFLTRVDQEKGLDEIKAILEEFPPARESGFLYSGIHEVFVARAEWREVIRRSLLKVLDTHRVVSHQKALIATTDNSSSVLRDRVRVEQRYYQRRCQDRLKRLYGALPEAVFQRLNSVYIWGVPKPLILPTSPVSASLSNSGTPVPPEATKKLP